jgi:2-polyprenyl-3-methyl-5-hydroxy-6-metoxy-1,4-benzoquinol methylase
MLNKIYRKTYVNLFNEILDRAANKGHYDECTISSYAHRNKIISWIFWKRIAYALALAGDLKNKRVLDFGCGGCVIFKYLNECNCTIVGCENQFFELSKDISNQLNIKADIYDGLFKINRQKFDVIFALDILEHVVDLDLIIDKFIELSHDRTTIVISGPTENLMYRAGRIIIGYADQARFHGRNIYDVENKFMLKELKRISGKNIFWPFTAFRVSLWSI